MAYAVTIRDGFFIEPDLSAKRSIDRACHSLPDRSTTRMRYVTGVGDMFIARPGVKDVSCFKMQHLFAASGPEMHVDTPVEDSEDFRVIVDAPAVGLVGPVQPHGRIVDPLDRQRVPWRCACILAGALSAVGRRFGISHQTALLARCRSSRLRPAGRPRSAWFPAPAGLCRCAGPHSERPALGARCRR